jgi:hypothetical protein
MPQFLDHGADDFDVDRLRQAGQLFERVLGSPGLRLGFDRDEKSLFRLAGGGLCMEFNIEAYDGSFRAVQFTRRARNENDGWS